MTLTLLPMLRTLLSLLMTLMIPLTLRIQTLQTPLTSDPQLYRELYHLGEALKCDPDNYETLMRRANTMYTHARRSRAHVRTRPRVHTLMHTHTYIHT
jgi:hypothetical protein